MGRKRGPALSKRKPAKKNKLTTAIVVEDAPPMAVTSPTPITQSDSPDSSSHGVLSGLFEAALRKFKATTHALTMLPLYAIASVCLGLALLPGIAFAHWVWSATAALSWPIHYLAGAIACALGFFIYGFTLILVLPAANFVLCGRLRAWRGKYYSLSAARWYIHNGLTYLARYTFLELITPTPFNILFYRWMGMRVGKGVQLNSTHISDPSLIEIGENATIGGSATIIGHYGMGGFLIMAPVRIGQGATIGLKAVIMAGVEIGENAKILPNSVVLPKTVVPAGETWGGVPAQKIDLRRKKSAA